MKDKQKNSKVSKSSTKKKADKQPEEDVYFSKRTIVDMITKGIGHTGLIKVLNRMNKIK